MVLAKRLNQYVVRRSVAGAALHPEDWTFAFMDSVQSRRAEWMTYDEIFLNAVPHESGKPMFRDAKSKLDSRFHGMAAARVSVRLFVAGYSRRNPRINRSCLNHVYGSTGISGTVQFWPRTGPAEQSCIVICAPAAPSVRQN